MGTFREKKVFEQTFVLRSSAHFPIRLGQRQIHNTVVSTDCQNRTSQPGYPGIWKSGKLDCAGSGCCGRPIIYDNSVWFNFTFVVWRWLVGNSFRLSFNFSVFAAFHRVCEGTCGERTSSVLWEIARRMNWEGRSLFESTRHNYADLYKYVPRAQATEKLSYKANTDIEVHHGLSEWQFWSRLDLGIAL